MSANQGTIIMPLFTINITETTYGFVEIQAKNFAEAQQKADAEYHNGNVFWANSEYRVEKSADESNAV